MTMDMIDIKKYHWLSPVFVIQSAVKMYQLYSEEVVTTKNEFKKVQEAVAAAFALLGMYQDQRVHYFMQCSRDRSPDILTLTLAEIPVAPYVEGRYQTVEVVTYEAHSDESIFEFLVKTKLSPKKAYDDKTIILCHVSKAMQIPDERDLHNMLKTVSPKPQIVILGKLKNAETKYTLMQVWPFAARIEYDAATLAKSYPQPPHMKLLRTMDKKVKFTHTNEVKAPTIYEVFGIDEEKVKKYLLK